MVKIIANKFYKIRFANIFVSEQLLIAHLI